MRALAVRLWDTWRTRLLSAREPRRLRKAPGSEGVEGAPVGVWDLVDEASWQSFPASDPPALTIDEPAPSRRRRR